MNIKKPFKVLTTATLIGSLSLSAVAPGSALAADQVKNTVNVKAENAYTPTKVILENEKGEKLSLSYDDYLTEVILSGATETEQLKVLNGYTLSHFVTEAGTFDAMTYLSALEKASKEDTVETILEGIKKAGEDVAEPKDYKEGSLTDGTLDPVDDNTDNIDVVEISAINNTVTVGAEYTLPSVVTAKLKNGSTKEVAVTWDGKIDTSKVGTQSIKGTVEGTDIKAELTVQVKYANTGVEGFAFLGSTTATLTEKPEAAEGANIFVNDEKQAQTVQANGSFFLEVNPAAVEVKIKKAGYFAAKVETAVAQNETAAVVAGLQAVTPNKLEINGTVKGADGEVLKSATVELYDETGKTKLAEAITSDAGTYKFGNSGLGYDTDEDGSNNPIKSTAAFLNEDNEAYNALDIDTKYVVKVSKPLETSNLDDVYKTYTTSVTTSDEQAITKTQTRVSSEYKVKEIKEATVDLKADTGVTLKPKADVTIFTEEGKTLLSEGNALVTGKGLELDAITGSDNKKLDLFDILKTGTKNPTLPTGKYYVLIQDGTNANTVYTMNVTEGTDVKGDTVTIKKAAKLGVNSTVGDVVYTDALLANGEFAGGTQLDKDDTLTQINKGLVDGDTNKISRGDDSVVDETVTASYKLYQDVDGVKIPLGEVSDSQYVMASATTASVTTALSEFVAKGNKYVVESTSAYTTGANGFTKTIDSESATEIVSAKSASTIKPVITFNGEANGRDVEVGGVKKYKLNKPTPENVTIKLLDKDGKEVAKATQAELAKNEALVDAFTSVRPGEYRLEVSAPGYETATTKVADAVRVLDFQNQEIAITVDAQAPTKLSGTITYTNGDTLAGVSGDDASVALYKVNEDKTLSYVTGDNIEVNGNEDASFNFVDVLEEGAKYRLVTRGAGFENKVTEFTATKGLNTADIKVTKGGNASATLTIVDTKKNKFNADPGAYVLDPEYLKEFGFYDEKTGNPITGKTTDGKNTVVKADTDNDGKVSTSEQNAFLDQVTNGAVKVDGVGTSYGLTYNGVHAVAQDGTDKKMFTVDGLSKGEQTLVIPSSATASGVDSIRYNEKSVKIDYVGQKLVSGVTVDIPTVQDGQVTYNVEGTVSNAGSPDDTVLVAAYQGDKLVDYVAAEASSGSYNYKLQLPNGKYTLKAYSNGELVGALENVAIQDNHVKGKNIALSTAK